MQLLLPASILDEIHLHCREAYPRECCGALVGTIEGGKKTVAGSVRLANAEPDLPERRFVIDTKQLLRLGRSAAAAGNEVIGFYHSHPDSPARPSPTDLEWAWPVYSYVIASVVHGEVADTRSYEVDETEVEKAFVEEVLEISTR
jgi:proteasome lid subunit RPN8/RPN11